MLQTVRADILALDRLGTLTVFLSVLFLSVYSTLGMANINGTASPSHRSPHYLLNLFGY